jgi:hypothetical protein
MHFDMFDKFGGSFSRSKGKGRPASKAPANFGRRPLPTEGTYPFVHPTEVLSLRQTSPDPENRAFRALDRHARWQRVYELSHGRDMQ